jgi:AsmA protein
MALQRRTLPIVLGSILALIVAVVLAIPLFLNADIFRNEIESTLSTSLGRNVSFGKLDLSVWSGSLVAQNATIADDPAFSTQPFLETGRVKIKSELLPLIFRHELHITGFTIDSPNVTLLRAANGVWNYSTLGNAAKKPATSEHSSTTISSLTVGHIIISNGQMTVGIQSAPGEPATPRRTYDRLNMDAKNFAFDKSFPFSASAHLPGDGTVAISGTAGPVNQQDASLTPFSAHVELKQLDPLATGFVESAAGITGFINAIDVQATSNGQQLHLTNLLIDTPKLTLVRTNTPTATKPPSTESNNMLSTLTADHLQIKDGTLTITTPGQAVPVVYQQLNAEVTNFSPATGSPFKLSAQIPGGGSLTADGNAGPLSHSNAAATPLNAHATLTHVDLASSGLIAPDAGISGLANVDLRALSDGQTLNANVSANIQGLRMAKNGSPSPKPVDLQLTVAQNMQALTGQIQRAVVTVGRAVINVTGTYQTSGPTTALNLQVNGQSVPIDEIEAFLPSVGVHLPSGSRLQGGTLTTSLNVTGSSASPIINGPVKLNNTNLAGFDLGSKLSTVAALTGAKTGSVTAIRSLSTNLRVANGDVRTDNLVVDVPALGTATGAGTVSAAGALNYQVVLKLTGLVGGGSSSAKGAGGIAGQLMAMIPSGAAANSIGGIASSALKNGIPVAIGGTTSNPTFTPNLSGLVSSGASNLTKGSKPTSKGQNTTDSLTNALGGLLKQH